MLKKLVLGMVLCAVFGCTVMICGCSKKTDRITKDVSESSRKSDVSENASSEEIRYQTTESGVDNSDNETLSYESSLKFESSNKKISEKVSELDSSKALKELEVKVPWDDEPVTMAQKVLKEFSYNVSKEFGKNEISDREKYMTKNENKAEERLIDKIVFDKLDKDEAHFEITMLTNEPQETEPDELYYDIMVNCASLQWSGNNVYYLASIVYGEENASSGYISSDGRNYDLDGIKMTAVKSVDGGMNVEYLVDDAKKMINSEVVETGTIKAEDKEMDYERYKLVGMEALALFYNDSLYRIELYSEKDSKLSGYIYMNADVPIDEELYKLPECYKITDTASSDDDGDMYLR